jgi:serine/threonine protein kinase/Tfp pilus assembly protein PilF
MEHKDWPQIEDLFHRAVSLTADERDTFLVRACCGNLSLRTEVESLIAAFENESELLEQPAFSLGMKVLSTDFPEESLVGKLIGTYRILGTLGKGGMGEVYLAEDSRLDRKIALKFLSNKFVDDAWARRQLVKEAQAVAKLDHPNICAVYGYEEADGHNFIVMQYCEGETLAPLISKGLEPKQIPNLAIKIVSAMVEAHSHGIIHRDIKPQNIIVTTSGQVKVLDFGLAKLVQQRQSVLGAGDSESLSSQVGLVIGTVSYMSPEQLRAERLDFRSDIFSFGIVLYEMISGKNPYSRESNAEVISAILATEPGPITKLPPALPAGISRIVQKCLKKDREQRYHSASELLLELEGLHKLKPAARQWQTFISRRTPAILALALLVLVALVSLYYLTAGSPKVRSLAVLPITTKSSDVESRLLSDGLTEGLISKLSGLSSLHVKAPTVVPSYESEDIARVRAGRDFNVDAVIFGTIEPDGNSQKLQVRLVRASDGSLIWQDEQLLRSSGILRLLEEISSKVVASMHVAMSEEEKKRLATQQTGNPDAFKLYVLGRHYLNNRNELGNSDKARTSFDQAIRLDPFYAQAYAGLADYYLVSTTIAYGAVSTKEAMDKARAAARKALEIDSTLCEAHTSLGTLKLRYDWNWQEAEREFKWALELNPDYAPAHYWYSNLLAVTGRFKEAIAESETTQTLDPFSPTSQMNLGRAYYYDQQYEKATVCLTKRLTEDQSDRNAAYILGFVYLSEGLVKESVALFEKLYAQDKQLGAAALGYAYSKSGRKNDAIAILNELEDNSKFGHVPVQDKALIYIGLNDKDRAFALLEEACKEHFASLPYLLIEPYLASIRSDPRFDELAKCAHPADPGFLNRDAQKE